ncbi:hypothetical protein B0H16DRAFT_380197 [Mycena metata]|uniref:F-box domain-containing protein n=1 Tax=Mycena metata TaxID=1033252 RepID=A0AAD7MJV3_9AGAR|nr:hypothetical protein B0H16DRAFT_380197 [Mycena metata]
MTPHSGSESTHRPPTQTERNSLAADRTRIAVIKAKILELQRSISSLTEENDLLQDRLDAYTYPVLTLPNELVSEIFLHFLPVYPQPPPIIGRSSPNVLGQICREWREIAFRTPVLWRAITLSLRNGKRLDQKHRLLELWLQRSGSCLLSIHMDLEVDAVDLEGDVGTETLDLFTHTLAAHSARWEYLRLYSPVHPFPSISAPLPFLRALLMGPVKPIVNGTPNTESLTQALYAAPLLRDVAVVFWREHCISLYPWSQLTRFIGHSILPHLFVDILAQAHNLTYCHVFVYGRGATQTARNVTLPYLSTLILRGLIPHGMSWTFLDVFTFPALRKLEVAETLLQGDPIGRLKSLVTRSRCSLEALYLENPTVPLESYRTALPTVGTIVDGELDPVNPWVLPGDEENANPSQGDSHADGGSSTHSDTDKSDSEDNEEGSDESD